MALGPTQPLIEMSTRSISWGKGGRCVRLTTLPASCAFFMKSGNLDFLEPSGPLRACNGTDLPIYNVLYPAERHQMDHPNLYCLLCVGNKKKWGNSSTYLPLPAPAPPLPSSLPAVACVLEIFGISVNKNIQIMCTIFLVSGEEILNF